VSRYRLSVAVLALAVAAAGVYALSARSPGMLVGAIMLQVAGSLLLHHRARSQAIAAFPDRAAAGVRTASLAAETVMPVWGWVLFVLPPLILAGAAFYLQANWDQIPDRFPVHWGIDGKPDRWAVKSFKETANRQAMHLNVEIPDDGAGTRRAEAIGSVMLLVVADTGPLRYLTEIGQIQILPKVVREDPCSRCRLSGVAAPFHACRRAGMGSRAPGMVERQGGWRTSRTPISATVKKYWTIF
jgi:hypothetical protein